MREVTVRRSVSMRFASDLRRPTYTVSFSTKKVYKVETDVRMIYLQRSGRNENLERGKLEEHVQDDTGPYERLRLFEIDLPPIQGGRASNRDTRPA